MSRVFIPHEPRVRDRDTGEWRPMIDLSPARAYGPITILFGENTVGLNTVPMVRMLKRKLSDFSDDDWIVCVGDPSLIATTAAVAAQVNRGRYKLLKWDKRLRNYIEVEVDLSGRTNGETNDG